MQTTPASVRERELQSQLLVLQQRYEIEISKLWDCTIFCLCHSPLTGTLLRWQNCEPCWRITQTKNKKCPGLYCAYLKVAVIFSFKWVCLPSFSSEMYPITLGFLVWQAIEWFYCFENFILFLCQLILLEFCKKSKYVFHLAFSPNRFLEVTASLVLDQS